MQEKPALTRRRDGCNDSSQEPGGQSPGRAPQHGVSLSEFHPVVRGHCVGAMDSAEGNMFLTGRYPSL